MWWLLILFMMVCFIILIGLNRCWMFCWFILILFGCCIFIFIWFIRGKVVWVVSVLWEKWFLKCNWFIKCWWCYCRFCWFILKVSMMKRCLMKFLWCILLFCLVILLLFWLRWWWWCCVVIWVNGWLIVWWSGCCIFVKRFSGCGKSLMVGFLIFGNCCRWMKLNVGLLC